jgi:hypothetical protein
MIAIGRGLDERRSRCLSWRLPGQAVISMRLGAAIRKLGPIGSAVTAVQIANLAREHWQAVPREDRARMQSLLRKSHGKPSNLSNAERRELRSLLGALELPRLVRRSVVNAAGIRRRHRDQPQ